MTSPSQTQGLRPRPLRILVGVQDEGSNGIETYAEQVAIAGCRAGHEVTLLTTVPSIADQVQRRMGEVQFDVVTLDLSPLSARRRYLERLWPQLQTDRVGSALHVSAKGKLRGRVFDAIHLNRAALAPYVDKLAKRVYVAGWFYPHDLSARAHETWQHARGPVLRRSVITAKSLCFFRADEIGYRAATEVVACTETLAAQLRGLGLRATACPPPIRVSPFQADDADHSAVDTWRLLICGADLSHPRKNLIDAVRALAKLAKSNRRITLRAIGQNPELLIREAVNLPENVSLEVLGPKSPQEVHHEMRCAHLLVLPSLYEEWGYVVVESILNGTPVVTYPVYPFADMLDGGLGVVASEK